MSESREKRNEIDYIFARYPLWIRYSGLPRELGPVNWTVFQRLLELRERFESQKFFYALERLAETSGIKNRRNMVGILDRLAAFKLIKYQTTAGRGKATAFEIIEPLNTPLSEEDVYRLYPRLSSKSYTKKLRDAAEEQKKRIHDHLLEKDKEKGIGDPLLETKKEIGDPLLNQEKVIHDPLLEAKKGIHDHPIKKIYIKRQQQQKDLFISGTPDDLQNVPNHNEPDNSNAVVASNTQNLKDYGISGELAERYTRIYAPHYIEDKIEIIEYKRFKGELIRNPGGMLKKAIEEDWQRPEGFSTRAQREEAARAAKEAGEAEKRKEKERLENIRREEEAAAAAEKWKKAAAPDVLAGIRERAVQEVKARFPDTDETLLRVPIRLEENRIIEREFVNVDSS